MREVQGRPRRREGRLGRAHCEERMNLFTSGQVVATPGALAAAEASGESLLDYVQRHLAGDWGEVDPEDARQNEFSVNNGLRLLSALHTSERN